MTCSWRALPRGERGPSRFDADDHTGCRVDRFDQHLVADHHRVAGVAGHGSHESADGTVESLVVGWVTVGELDATVVGADRAENPSTPAGLFIDRQQRFVAVIAGCGKHGSLAGDVPFPGQPLRLLQVGGGVEVFERSLGEVLLASARRSGSCERRPGPFFERLRLTSTRHR